MLDELLGMAKEDRLVAQEVVTHFEFSIFRSLGPEATARSRDITVTYYQLISKKSLIYRTLVS